MNGEGCPSRNSNEYTNIKQHTKLQYTKLMFNENPFLASWLISLTALLTRRFISTNLLLLSDDL